MTALRTELRAEWMWRGAFFRSQVSAIGYQVQGVRVQVQVRGRRAALKGKPETG